MAEYQVLARKYRPQKFHDVVAQDAIVTTLKNAIKHKRLAHAYLFCGSRGTGKTTLARLFAKALNCPNLSDDIEPCNNCSSCREIAHGNSMDVLEIDGASHRGIDDIRQINENVGYSTSTGGYKVYIIDEVHMLTKEAFNALLKTLEEPPPKVKFFFATTEPHKVLPTILSRCQRFNLNRIPAEKIVTKLGEIVRDLNLKTDDEALRMVANRADGGLRDAESLLDQIYSFHGGDITKDAVASILGIMQSDSLFEIDKAGKEGRLNYAFEIAHQVYSQGKDLVHFVEMLVEHFRNILLVKLSGSQAPFLELSENDRQRYAASAELYSQEQCMNLLDFLIEAQSKIRFAPSSRVALEAILLYIMRSHKRVPIEVVVRKLAELEHAAAGNNTPVPDAPRVQAPTPTPQPTPPPSPVAPAPTPVQAPPRPPVAEVPPPPPPEPQAIEKTSIPEAPPAPAPRKEEEPNTSMTVDPTPTQADFGFGKPPPAPPPRPTPTPTPTPKVAAPPPQPQVSSTPKVESVSVEKGELKSQSHYDTLLQFAAVELEGKLEKKQVKR